MKSKDVTKTIRTRTLPARIKKVRSLMESAGSKIAAVHFRKRSDGELRTMSYRLHVKKPSTAPAPKGNKGAATKIKDKDNLQMTVLDVNKVVRDKEGNIIGRGAYRTVPLENVERISVGGEVYQILT